MRNGTRTSRDDAGLFYVYVIELRPLPHDPPKNGRPDVYVGYSWSRPEDRFDKHLNDERASRHVKKRGLRLLPRLYRQHNPMHTREQAKRKEQELRATLERQGYRVYGSCSPRKAGCWL